MRSLLLASLLASTAMAQTPINYFEQYSGCTNFTSRGAAGVNAADSLLQHRTAHFAGVGHDASGSGTSLVSFRYVTQDQNAATQETYSLVIRADASGAPDPTPAGLLFQSANLLTPAGGAAPTAWQITATLMTPTTALPLCNTFYHGFNLAAAPLWTADGQSTHMCSYYALAGQTACPLAQADNPAPTGVPNVAWNIIAGAPTQPGSARSYRFDLGVTAAVMNIGNTDPTLTSNAAWTCACAALGIRSWGIGGQNPQNGGSRNDGLDVRVRDLANQGGVFITFLGGSFGCPGIPLSGLANGALYLNPGGAFIQLATGALAPTGEGIATLLPPNSAPASVVNRPLDFQSFTLGATFALPGNLTNRATVIYLP